LTNLLRRLKTQGVLPQAIKPQQNHLTQEKKSLGKVLMKLKLNLKQLLEKAAMLCLHIGLV